MDSSMSEALPVMAIMGAFLVMSLLMLIPQIFYLLTLQKCLTKVQEKNRGMSPGLVWLNLIPLFNLGWHFYVVKQIQNSLSNEYKERNLQGEENFGYKIGLTMCILSCSGIIPFIGPIASLAGLVLWIIYWIKIAGFSKELDNPSIAATTTEIPDMPQMPDMPEMPQTPENPQT